MSVDPLPPFRLEVFFERWEFAARHHLAASDAETLTVAELLALGTEEDRATFGDLRLAYVDTWGGDALRDAIASTYTQCVGADVLAFAGAEEALFWALHELLEAGDHAVITVPNYQSTETIPLSVGAELTGIVIDPLAGRGLEVDEVRAALRPTTKLVVVNFPHNPTGYVPSGDAFRALVTLCEERGIRLLSDEVFRGLERDPARMLPQAADLSATAVSLNVMSKSYGLPGLRVGWLASRDRELLQRLERRKHYTSICNAGPSEHLATIALRAGERIRERNRAIVETNLPLFGDFFGRHAELFDWYEPDGGCVAFPRYRGRDGVEEFCSAAVEEEGVILLPSSIFASTVAPVAPDRFRIGVGRRDPRPGLDALARVVERRRSTARTR